MTRSTNFSQPSSNLPSTSSNSELEDIKPKITKIKKNPIRKRDKFICPKCSKSYKHEFSMKSHIDLVCGLSTRYKCPHCEKVGKYYYNIITHSKIHHPGLDSYAIDTITNQIKRLQREMDKPLRNSIIDEKPAILENSSQDCIEPASRVKSSRRQKRINVKQEKDNTETFDVSNSTKDSLRKLEPNTCHNCGKSFTLEYGLSRHILEGCEQFRYSCPYCQFKEQKLFVAFCHLSKEHAGSKIYMVDNVTGKNVELGCALNSEIPDVTELNDSSNGEIVYKNNYPTSKIIDNEVKNPVNKIVIQSPEDSKQFQKDSNKEYECPNKCGRYFGNFRSIHLHVKASCVKVKRFKCPFCEELTHAFRFMVTHIKKSHPEEKIYALDLKRGQLVYNNPYAQLYEKKKSNRKKENPEKGNPKKENPKQENPKKDIPNKNQKKDSNSERKQLAEEAPKTIDRIKHEKIFPCTKGCGRLFSYKHHMRTHVMQVCNLPKRYKCPYCAHTCKLSSSVTNHINNRHRNLKNYFIDVLKEENPDSADCENNENIEPSEEQTLGPDEEKPTFKCPNCSKVYKTLSNMWTHIKQCHDFRSIKLEAESVHLDDSSEIDPIQDEPNEVDQSVNQETVQNAFNSTEVLDASNNFIYECDQNDEISEDEISRNDLSEDEINKEISKFVEMEADKINVEELDEFEEIEKVDDLKMRKMVNLFSKKFVCPNNCGSAYSRESTLKSHLRYQCQQSPRFSCPYCKHFTRQTSNGYAHVRKMHSDNEIFLIDIVTKEKIRNTRLKKTAVHKLLDEDNREATELSNKSDDEIDEPDEPIVEIGNEGEPLVYKCHFCRFYTEIPEEGYDHMKKKHPNEDGCIIGIKSESEDEVESHTENDA